MRPDAHTNLDIWIARNLAFIAALQFAVSFVGPFALGLLAIFYQLVKLRYWNFHSLRETIFGLLAALLVVFAIPLFVQYCRYPRLAFGIRPMLFWLGSMLYVPTWIAVFLFSGEQSGWPVWRDLRENGELLFVGALLPGLHFLLSLIGAYASRHRNAKPIDETSREPLRGSRAE